MVPYGQWPSQYCWRHWDSTLGSQPGSEPSLNWPGNRACHPGGCCSNYHSGALYFEWSYCNSFEDEAPVDEICGCLTNIQIFLPELLTIDALHQISYLSSDEFQRLDYMTGYQDSSLINGCGHHTPVQWRHFAGKKINELLVCEANMWIVPTKWISSEARWRAKSCLDVCKQDPIST